MASAASRRRTEVKLRVAHSPEATNPLDQRGIPHYSVTDPLPPFCLTHGRPAVGRYEASIQFDGTQRHSLQTRLASGLAADNHPLTPAAVDSEADSVVHVSWPICRRCRLRIRAREFAFLFLVFAAMCTVIGLFAAAQAGLRQITTVLAFVLGLGAPAILLAITAVFTNVDPVWNVKRSPDGKYLIVTASRSFAERLQPRVDPDRSEPGPR